MEIKVNEQAQKFHLATNQGNWQQAIGHEIQVGKYRFCAIPIGNHINVSEVTTGIRAINVHITQEVWDETRTKEGTVKHLYKVGKRMEEVINKVGSSNLDKLIEDSKKNNLEKIGEMPPIEDVDMDWMSDEVSDVTH
ncbi:TPA: hypothetical protein QCU10_001472 [Bacillus anthracis]|nr:hypothetical protein [Bacillus cereus biovar anthracis]HDR6237708.1 hypothetical protein [Bacillus cereus biovar anthracis]HDR6248868.1 hypothetical protein [Bacillus cereus biovar anthracis]